MRRARWIEMMRLYSVHVVTRMGGICGAGGRDSRKDGKTEGRKDGKTRTPTGHESQPRLACRSFRLSVLTVLPFVRRPLFLVRRRPPGHLFRTQGPVRADPGVAKRTGEHIAQVLGPR